MTGSGKPRGRPVRRFLERVLLGAVMTVVAFVAERWLVRSIRRKAANGNGAVPERPGGLAATPE